MSRAARYTCIAVRLAYVFAAVLVIGAVLIVVTDPQRTPIVVCLVGALSELAVAWALPRGLNRLGEDHWLYDWRAYREKQRRRNA